MYESFFIFHSISLNIAESLRGCGKNHLTSRPRLLSTFAQFKSLFTSRLGSFFLSVRLCLLPNINFCSFSRGILTEAQQPGNREILFLFFGVQVYCIHVRGFQAIIPVIKNCMCAPRFPPGSLGYFVRLDGTPWPTSPPSPCACAYFAWLIVQKVKK